MGKLTEEELTSLKLAFLHKAMAGKIDAQIREIALSIGAVVIS